ncbi:dehydrodolichyl diphosphate synthase 2-like [Papaver somniferum]|uniref:dehydrodolichyl diphosphate synthase 2-like n=1 Tax=Papaver somniferum TaxID=3469 RepID=UPI000E6FB486|nr:dehydrodolichyl diphosphate synthase 2-like [Papaver somniferum]
MEVYQKGIFEEGLELFMRKGIQVSLIGDPSKLQISLWITKTVEATKNNSRLHFILAINHSGREDIVQACQSICRRVMDNLIRVEDIDETIFSQQLETNCTEFPYPDLLIRTSGEQRISNFLMWQLAYTELYFEECMWPDFGEKEFVKALLSFQGRHRRYGGQD